jgi:hypothetical protein
MGEVRYYASDDESPVRVLAETARGAPPPIAYRYHAPGGSYACQGIVSLGSRVGSPALSKKIICRTGGVEVEWNPTALR